MNEEQPDLDSVVGSRRYADLDGVKDEKRRNDIIKSREFAEDLKNKFGITDAIRAEQNPLMQAYMAGGAAVQYTLLGGGLANDVGEVLKSEKMPDWYNNTVDVGVDIVNTVPTAVYDLGKGINQTINEASKSLFGTGIYDDRYFEGDLLEFTGGGMETGFGKYVARPIIGPIALMALSGGTSGVGAVAEGGAVAGRLSTAANYARNLFRSNFWSQSAAKGAAYDFFMTNPENGTITDALVDFGVIEEENLMNDLLGTNRDDNWFVSKLKGAVEGAFAGAILEPALDFAVARPLGYALDKLGHVVGKPGPEIKFVTELNQDRVKDLAERGLLTPEEAEAFANGKLWETSRFNLNVKERTDVVDKVTTAYGKEDGEVMVSIMDRMFTLLAAEGNMSLGDVYKKAFAGIEITEDSGKDGAGLAQLANVLRQQRSETKSAFVIQKNPTTSLNIAESFNNIDALLKVHNDPWSSPEAATKFLNDLFNQNEKSSVPINPLGLIQQIKDTGSLAVKISRPEYKSMREAARHGLAFTNTVREGYKNGSYTAVDTTMLGMWGIISRMLTPYRHEAAALDAMMNPKTREMIEKAIRGEHKFSLTTKKVPTKDATLDEETGLWSEYEEKKVMTTPELDEWVASLVPEGSPGRPGIANLNAFVSNFLYKLSSKADDGRTYLEMWHDIIADPSMSGRQKRRKIMAELPDGHGIGLKVHSFILLLTGHHDVVVLDRVQISNLWEGGVPGEATYNLYDGMKDHGAEPPQKKKAELTKDEAKRKGTGRGKKRVLETDEEYNARTSQILAEKQQELDALYNMRVEKYAKIERYRKEGFYGNGIAELVDDFRGLGLYESIEMSMEKRLKEVYDKARAEAPGEFDDEFSMNPSMGLYHWETWNIKSMQEAKHGSLAYLFKIKDNKYAPQEIAYPISNEARRGALEYGNDYNAERRSITVNIPDGSGRITPKELSLKDYAKFRDKLKQLVPEEWSKRATKQGRRLWSGGVIDDDVIPEIKQGAWFDKIPPESRDKIAADLASYGEFDPKSAGDVVVREVTDQSSLARELDQTELSQPDPKQGDMSAPARRGRVRFLEDTRAVVSLFKNVDPKKAYDRSTFVHELAHIFRRQSQDLAPEFYDQLVKAFGIKDGNSVTQPEEERFAELFEKYLGSGEAPIPEMKSVFEKFKAWMQDIYAGILSSPLKHDLTQAQRDVFDRMLGKGYNRANPGAARPSTPTSAAVPAITAARADYIKNFPDAPNVVGGKPVQFDEELSKRIADEFEKMESNPDDPAVRESYEALAEETLKQYEYLKSLGYRMIPDQANGYKSSTAMMEDLAANKRLYVFKTIAEGEESNFGKTPITSADRNPLLRKTGEIVMDSNGNPYELTVNDVFRFVHDVFGHASDGVTFGPKGEERAWLSHAQMFSRKALPAMTTETRGQNSWVNSGKHMRRDDGSIPKMGDPDYEPQEMTGKDGAKRQYAEQKVGLLPSWCYDHPHLDDPSDGVKLVQRIKETFENALKGATSTQAALEYSLKEHINFDRISSPEEAQKLLKMYEPLFGALRLPHIENAQTMDAIKEAAEDLSKKPEEVIQMMTSGIHVIEQLAQHMVALRIMENSAALNFVEVAKRVDMKNQTGAPITKQDADSLLNAQKGFMFIGELRSRIQRGAAVTVTSGNIKAGTDPDFDVDAMLKAFKGENSPGAQTFLKLAIDANNAGNKSLQDAFSAAAENESVRSVEAATRMREKLSAEISNARAKREAVAAAEKAKAEKVVVDPQAGGAVAVEGAAVDTGTAPANVPEAGAVLEGGPMNEPGITVTNANTGGSVAPPTPTAGGTNVVSPSTPTTTAVASGATTPGAAPASLPVPVSSGQQLTAKQMQLVTSIARAAVNAAAQNQTGRLSKALVKASNGGTTALAVLLEHHKAFLLSGVPTFAVNIGSGGLMTAMQPIYRLAGAVAELDVQEMKNSFRLGAGIVGALADMFRISNMTRAANTNGNRGLDSVLRTMKTEVNTLTRDSATEPMGVVRGKNFIDPQKNKGPLANLASKGIDLYGRVLRIPFTINQSGEEFFNQINYNAFIRMKALEAADASIWNNPSIPKSQKQQAAEVFVDKFMKDSYDNIGSAALDPNAPGSKFMHNDAIQYAKSAAFAQDLSNGVGQWLQEGVEKFPAFKLILPFVKAPTNLIRHTISLVPGLGFAERARVRNKLAGMPITGESKDELLRLKGQMLLGSAFCGYAAYLVMSGKITGSGPTNKEERNILLASGWRPYSFVKQKADGTVDYIEYRRADPYSSILGLVADFAESRSTLDDEEADSVAARIVYSLGRNLTSKTYLTGLSQFFDALVDSKGYAAQKWVQSFTGSFVPAALARYTQSVSDPTLRETREWYDGIKRRLPGYSEELPPRRNILGEVITPNPGWVGFNDESNTVADRIGTFASPVGFSKRIGDTVKEELVKLKYGFSAPQYMMGGIDLRRVKRNGRDAYDVMFEKTGTTVINGKTLSQSLEKLFFSKEYKALPDPFSKQDAESPKVRAVNNLLAAYRAKAKAEMLKEFPELIQAYRSMKMQSATGEDQGSLEILRSLEDLK